jgi:deazaflavin-dependent oxidoreductase (nitroreductase family)
MMWFNSIMIFILRSPLHGLLSGSTILITCTGRKSGKVLTVPTNYVREDGKLLVTSFRKRTWWRNLRGGVSVTVRLQGRDCPGEGKVIEDADEVAEGLRVYFRRVPQWAKYSGVMLDANGEPNLESVKRAVQDKVMVEIRIAP